MDPVPAHPIKGIFCSKDSLATCVLTFVFLSVVIYHTMELKAKLAAPQHQRPQSDVGLASIVREDQRGSRSASVLFSSSRAARESADDSWLTDESGSYNTNHAH